MRVISTYGIHHTSSESALIVYLGDVYWWKKHQDHRAMPLITIRRHYGAFHTHAKIWQSGFFWLTMYEDTILSGDVERVRGMGISIQEMPYHSPTTFTLSSSMSKN
jgi:hypothetical protein